MVKIYASVAIHVLYVCVEQQIVTLHFPKQFRVLRVLEAGRRHFIVIFFFSFFQKGWRNDAEFDSSVGKRDTIIYRVFNLLVIQLRDSFFYSL